MSDNEGFTLFPEHFDERQKGKPLVGVDIPTREEIKALVDALSDHWRPLLMTPVFTGMRSSEIRGPSWRDFDSLASTISVHQRADEFGRWASRSRRLAHERAQFPKS